MKIKWTMSNGLVGCKISGEIDVDEHDSDDEIEEAVRDAVMERLEWEWVRDKETA